MNWPNYRRDVAVWTSPGTAMDLPWNQLKRHSASSDKKKISPLSLKVRHLLMK
uniref:Uncharacterized protein n=1 Tax=Anguilla anguilla TaxID=7936 RepID=A0A0E9TM18_ANGAN